MTSWLGHELCRAGHLPCARSMTYSEPKQRAPCRQELAAAVVGEGLRPLQPAGLLPALGQLLDRCWAAEPQERPAFAQIAEELRHMQVGQQKGRLSSDYI